MTEEPRRRGDDKSLDLEGFLALLPRTSTALEITIYLSQVFEPIDHLRQHIQPMLARLAELDSQSLEEVADQDAAGGKLSESQRRMVRELAERIGSQQEQRLAGLEIPVGLRMPDACDADDPFAFMASLDKEIDLYSAIASEFMPAFQLSFLEQAYLADYIRAATRSSHLNLVLRSLAIIAMSQIQPYLGRLLGVVLRAEAGAARTRESISEEVRLVLRQGPEEWRERLIRRYGLTELEQALDWGELDSAWDLRNLLLHRGGVIDETYREAHPDSPPVGTICELAIEDVERLFDIAGTCRFAFAVAATESVRPRSGIMMAGEHYLWYWREVERGRWRAALGIARVAMAFSASPEDAAAAQCNVWVAQERGEGLELIRRDVEAWNVKGLPRKYQLAKAILLQDDTKAVALTARLLDSGDLTVEEVATSPIFARLRESGQLPR